MLGLGQRLTKISSVLKSYIKDGLKLYMPYKKNDEVQFVGTGSTSFDGVDDYVDVGTDIDFPADTEFSIAFWVKWNNVTENCAIIGDYIGGAGSWPSNGIASYSGNIIFYCGNSNLTVHSHGISNGEWAHLAFVRRNLNSYEHIEYFINGVKKVTDTGAGADNHFNPTNWYFGSKGGGNFFDGSLKNVAIWNRALTATEVQNVMYKQYAEVSGRLADNLVSWWALDATNLGSELVSDVDTYDASLLSSTWQGGSGATISLVDGIGGRDNVLKVLCDGSDNENAETTQAISLTTGKAYQLSFDFYVPSGQTVTGVSVYARNGGSSGSPSEFETHITPTANTWTSKTISYVPTGTTDDIRFLVSDGSGATSDNKDSFYLDNVSFKEVQMEDLKGSNEGSIYGATIDTDLYGGYTPVKPRVIDNAPTVQADAIGSGSAYFNGSNDDYIDCGSIDFGANDFSMVAWYNADSNVDYSAIVSNKDNSSPNSGTQIRVRGSDLELLSRIDSTNFEDAKTTLPSVNEWVHVAGTVDRSGSQKLYVNGVLKGTDDISSKSGDSLTSADNFRIGSNESVYGFDGNIAQVGVWMGVLSQETIQSVMEKTFEELTADEKSSLSGLTTHSPNNTATASATGLTEADATTGWAGGDTASVNSVSHSTPQSGTYHLQVTSNSNRKCIGRIAFSGTSGKIYKINGYIKGTTDNGTAGESFRVYNDTASLTLTTGTLTADTWVAFEAYWRQTTTGTNNIDIGTVSDQTTGDDIFIDNVTIQLVTHDLVSYWALDEADGNGVVDKVDETLGSELITNGTFDSGISGWTDISSGDGSIAWNSSGYMEVIGLGLSDRGKANTSFTTVSGSTYKFVATKTNDTNMDVKVGTSSGGGEIAVEAMAPTGTNTYYFTATSTTTHISFWEAGAGTCQIDDVSVKLVNGNAGILK